MTHYQPSQPDIYKTLHPQQNQDRPSGGLQKKKIKNFRWLKFYRISSVSTMKYKIEITKISKKPHIFEIK